MSRFIQREFSRADMNLHTNIDNGQLITNFLVNKGIAPTLKDFDPSPEKAKKVGIKNEEEVSWEEKRNQELDKKRQNFYNAMSDTLKDDKDGHYDSIVAEKAKRNHIDEFGNLSKEMLDELKEFKHEILVNLEENLKNTRLPTEDIFGIKRRYCKVCEQACNGYEPNTLMVPQAGEFPTFCKNCKCPAHFHTISLTPDDIAFPEQLRETIKNHNIASKDLNFNCVMMAFQVREQQQKVQNISELMTIMKEESLEIISIENRHLEIEEAIYLKNRMISQTENIVMRDLGLDHHGRTTGHHKVNEIRRDGAHGSAFIGKSGAHDAFLLNKHADHKEARIIQMTQKTQNKYVKEHVEHIPGVSTLNNKPQQIKNTMLTQKNILDTINQRVPIGEAPEPSIARTSVVDTHVENQLDNIEDTINMIRREPIVPTQKDKTFKVKSNAKAKTQIKKKLLHAYHQELTEEEQEALLTQQIERDPLLHELITKEVLILAISSTTYQNLNQQIKTQVMSKIQAFLPPYEMPLLYISETKINSIEDTLLFFPALFRLTKSIVVADPVQQTLISSNRPGLDITTDIQLTLRKTDFKNPDLMSKVQTLMDRTAMNDDDFDQENDLNLKNRSTIRIKTSQKLKSLLLKRENLRATQSLGLDPNQNEEEEWVTRAKAKEKAIKKQQKLLSQKNKLLYNYGVLHDFFNYSAMSIQQAVHDVDFNNPPTNEPKDGLLYSLKNEQTSEAGKQNIFAIAKIGLPNLILPSSLDIRLSNYNAYSSYLHLADSFFPTLSQSHLSVLVIRPLLVKNGLNDILVQILKVNDFTILKRKVRMLTKAEVVFMAEQERVSGSKEKCEMYYNLMMEGECEIVAVTKIGAVSDLKSIVDGSAPLGRRRIAQLDEDTSAVRTNVDAVNSMFEITPFTSMSEFLDLEDFIITHSKLDKYRKKSTLGASVNRINDQLYLQKIEHVRRELNLFSRYFNLVAHAPMNEQSAQKEMCVLMPEVAIIEEVIVMLNPMYGPYIEAAKRLLSRMGFKTLQYKQMTLTEEDSANLFKEKLNANTSADQQNLSNSYSYTNGEKLSKFLAGSEVHIWHLTKISGDREIRALFHEAQIELEDVFSLRVKQTPFKPQWFPYLFFFMDSPYMFETAFNMLYGPRIAEVTGQLLVDGMEFTEKRIIIELALQLTVGDSIKELSFDKLGNLVPPPQPGQPAHLLVTKLPQIFQLYGNPKGSTSVHTLVESEQHGLYEIRFARLPHKGDFYQMHIQSEKINLELLKKRYFTKFQALNHYYNEVNKHLYNVCPAFYRFKISPLISEGKPGCELLNRVFEVEEYMGRTFIESLATMHQEHVKMLKNTVGRSAQGIGRTVQQMLLESEQKSMPPYLWGGKLAKMCHDLQQIKGSPLVIGAGRLIYENNQLRGEIRTDYYRADRARYLKCLDDFKLGWGYYLSTLECELIESKLRRIIDSQTFKHTRTQGLALIPDRITDINLRISEKLQLLVEEALDKDSPVQFYEHLLQDTLDPAREERTVNLVQSILHTLHLESTKQTKNKAILTNNQGKGFTVESLKETKQPFDVHRDCAIVNVEVARRPKYQLIASVLYYINFYLRRVDRKTELFDDVERQYAADTSHSDQLYDQVLDTLYLGVTSNYGKDELNYALDMVTLKEKLAVETEFERTIREKQEMEARLKEAIKERAEDEMRKRRGRMTFEELLKSVQDEVDPKEEQRKQMQALRKFVEEKGYMNESSGNSGFMQVLKETQSYMGPYALKMANDYLKKQEIQKKEAHEKISFVKMEYFLYAVTEAHRCVGELRLMEARINDMHQELEIAHRELSAFGNDIIPGYFKNKQQSSNYQEKLSAFEDVSRRMEQLKYQISMKENELVMIFRELMSWDFYVPDYYFDKDLMLDMKRQEQLQETYLLPTRTFWKPVYFDAFKESEILKPQFAKVMRDFANMPKDLQGDLDKHFTDSERRHYPRQGVLVSCLRPYEVKEQQDFIKFDKFFSRGEWMEQQELDRIKKTISTKLTRRTVDHSVRFKPTA